MIFGYRRRPVWNGHFPGRVLYFVVPLLCLSAQFKIHNSFVEFWEAYLHETLCYRAARAWIKVESTMRREGPDFSDFFQFVFVTYKYALKRKNVVQSKTNWMDFVIFSMSDIQNATFFPLIIPVRKIHFMLVDCFCMSHRKISFVSSAHYH